MTESLYFNTLDGFEFQEICFKTYITLKLQELICVQYIYLINLWIIAIIEIQIGRFQQKLYGQLKVTQS